MRREKNKSAIDRRRLQYTSTLDCVRTAWEGLRMPYKVQVFDPRITLMCYTTGIVIESKCVLSVLWRLRLHQSGQQKNIAQY